MAFKIILAVDPYEEELRPSPESFRVLKAWALKPDTEVEAVYVLRGNRSGGPTYFSALDVLRFAVERFRLGVYVNSKVLVNETTGRHKTVEAFRNYAETVEADLVMVMSHGRKWISRLMLGSFAEELLAESHVPVLFLGLDPEPHETLKSVLYPTDFSDPSKSAFQLFLKQVESLKTEVIIYHLVRTNDYIYGYEMIPYEGYVANLKAQKKWAIDQGNQWLRECVKRGYHARVIVEEGEVSVVEAIEQVAQKNDVSLIGIMTSQKALEAAITGSAAFQLFRSRKFGVWAIGPTALDDFVGKRRIPPSEINLTDRPSSYF